MNYQTPQNTDIQTFVKYWSGVYNSATDARYDKNIGQPLSEERIHELFIWKNGSKLSKLKHRSVCKNYIPRISELEKIPKSTSATEWLKEFGTGEAIWNIFFLHVWNPQLPIFDQHVYRAMQFILTAKGAELPGSKTSKTKIYLNEYLPFYIEMETKLLGLPPRDLDRALWSFGKFLKQFKRR